MQIPQAEAFEAVCDAAGRLLEVNEVRDWILSSFPVVLVDEGQDLTPGRLKIVQGLAAAGEVFIAADEFQCLDQQLRPNPLLSWLTHATEIQRLAGNQRTSVPELLAAAAAIRNGNAPARNTPKFKIFSAPGRPLATTYLVNAIAWRQGNDVAVLTPSMAGGFAAHIVRMAGEKAWGQQQNGPYSIAWEQQADAVPKEYVASLGLGENVTIVDALNAIDSQPKAWLAKELRAWLIKGIGLFGRTQCTRDEMLTFCIGRAQTRRRQLGALEQRFSAMTIQQAKNREFDGVVVLWPFQVGGDDEQKRRLLYNAVTRARLWCTVIVQGPAILQAAPFI